MRKLILATIALVSFSQAAFAQEYSIYGYVKDGSTGETLPGATVVAASGTATAANEYGFYSLSLPAGAVILRVSFLGYEDKTLTLSLSEKT